MSTRHAALLVALCLFGALAGTDAWAQAPAPAEAVKAMLGSWEFSNADRDRRCTVTFRNDAAAMGMKIEFDKGCAGAFPFIKEAAGWTVMPNGLVRLLDGKGKALLDFSEVEDGIYEAPRPGEGILFLQTAASLNPAPPSTDQMAGNWGVVRGGGRPICTLTLSTAPLGEESFALTLKPGCDPLVARFGPSSWQMDRGELVLKGARDQNWRFEETDPDTWQRIPETRDPMTLLRQ